MLGDYDAHCPNEIFAERGTDRLTLADAYAVQRAVAELRLARGERCIGYKVGCVSAAVQRQFGLNQAVRGYLWESEAHISGCRLGHTRFANLAIEGEIALRLSRDIPTDPPASRAPARDADLSDYVECWFPVIELHNDVFRGATPTSQELVAGNAMHAGFVAPPIARRTHAAVPVLGAAEAVAHAGIRVELDGELVESQPVAALPGGPLGSVHWLVSSLAPAAEDLKAGDIVLTGSPGRLIPVSAGCAVTVNCEGQRVELFVERAALVPSRCSPRL